MKVFQPLFFLLITSVTAIHCNKDDGGTNNVTDTPSSITITNPMAGTIVLNGSTLRVEGEMTDLNLLATAKVEVKNKTTGAVLFQQSNPTSNVSFYRFTWNWIVTGISATTPATVKITAVDKLSNQVTKEVDVTLEN